ncbi:SHOCT domain-containing protein [Leifsonia sp. McL0607]|uniref:SHOCT domain-containing protein n=1 Tax=Leifsonia sp. McL0607 TaxID=3415672 RepID=UPI003CEB16B2
MWGWMMGGAPLGWLIWLVVPLLLVAGLIVLLVLTLTRRGAPPESGPGAPGVPRAPSAREILDQRYARGEIDHDDYIRRRDELGRS